MAPTSSVEGGLKALRREATQLLSGRFLLHISPSSNPKNFLERRRRCFLKTPSFPICLFLREVLKKEEGSVRTPFSG